MDKWSVSAPPNQVKCLFTGNQGPLFRLPQMKSFIRSASSSDFWEPRESSCSAIFIGDHVGPFGQN